MKQAACKTKHMFIEKPIFESCKYVLEDLPLSSKGIYYVACPLRYSPVIKYIESLIEKEKVYSARAISSSYLPDWRKATDYRNIYSARKSQGGGVTLDLIHEWDYLTYLFGMPLKVYNLNGQYSDLEIDSDDISVYIAKYKDKIIELHLDYFGRGAIRQLELFCRDYVIIADFINMQVEYKGLNEKIIQFDKEDIYIDEMNNFIDMILYKANNNNDIYHAYKVLNIAASET
jgi:predicted dehydrogenase